MVLLYKNKCTYGKSYNGLAYWKYNKKKQCTYIFICNTEVKIDTNYDTIGNTYNEENAEQITRKEFVYILKKIKYIIKSIKV